MSFGLNFCTPIDLIIIYIKILYLEFSKTSKQQFQFFLKELHGARAPFVHFPLDNLF
jgi:hypothetical protein